MNPVDDLSSLMQSAAAKYRAGDVEGSDQLIQKILAIDSHRPHARFLRSLILLINGDYQRGFAEYEWRWLGDELKRSRPNFSQPAWNGSDPSGRKIFVYLEQGYGDMIQFVRYLPLLHQRGAEIILECSMEMSLLMRSLKGVARLVPLGSRIPNFDFHVPLLSLPKIFGTALQTVPSQVPYLSADTERAIAWQNRLEEIKGLKVGMVWAGQAAYQNDANRSMSLEALSPLLKMEGVQAISLQKGRQFPAQMSLIDWTARLLDFADTAALIAGLDLVIGVDTAVVHLAGALGKKVWVMLPHVADWRWLRDRDDSPWYPTMRLFRQTSARDWPGVVQRIAVELQNAGNFK